MNIEHFIVGTLALVGILTIFSTMLRMRDYSTLQRSCSRTPLSPAFRHVAVPLSSVSSRSSARPQ